MERIESQLLVAGGGGAGISAAISAASNGMNVTVVDDNPAFGGQIWRSGIGSKAPQEAEILFKQLENKNISLLHGHMIFDRDGGKALIAKNAAGVVRLGFEKLVIAAGARERFIPFPGWTLPNVFGAGGLQALVKGGFSVEGKKIVIAGTGPLLIAVADFLTSKGAEVLFIVEQTGFTKVFLFGAKLLMFPSKFAQAVRMKLKPGTPEVHTNAYITAAFGKNKLESVAVWQDGIEREIECDILATGFHLVPNLELAKLLGCETDNSGVIVDDYQKTSLENVFAAGETTGIAGIEAACIEGEIAGHAAAGNSKAAKNLFRKRDKHRRFAALLNKTFELRRELRDCVKPDTIVCRCEDVPYEELSKFKGWRDAKLQTRCGMGPCQGRICGPAVEFLFGWKPDGVRPPIFPVKLEDLGE